MCQIIALKTTKKKLKKISKDKYIQLVLQKHLENKGGDYYSGGLTTKELTYKISEKASVAEIIKEALSFLEHNSFKKGDVQLLLFSRQQPEMEISKVKNQPYTKDDCLIAIHGTIYNDKELAKDLGVKIKADTEIFKYLPITNWDKAKGAYAIISINHESYPLIVENGLKIWKYKLTQSHPGKKNYLADVFTTGEISAFKPNAITLVDEYSKRDILFAAFSGGMDISLSVFNALANNNYKKLVLNYFAWGSKAEENEMLQLEKFKDFYSINFPGLEVEVKIWEAEKYFNEYFEMNGAPLPKISVFNYESEAESLEAESPLSYVPYRNTQFAILLASKAEALGLKNVDILFGLNLSEGMVFMDNSEGWLEAINQTIKLGGKDFEYTGSYNIIAPYYPRTKTNMLKEFKENYGFAILEQLLSLSKSCYYPNADGSPCGKCGSCLLREKALKGITDD
jgi:7-cyano-7-deazaguanine synthase in queuosine biosynthesis